MYDYVIVGAGSAGCVLAARLSEDRTVRVLVLEAGPPTDIPEAAMPAAFLSLFKGPLDWDYATVPQRHAANRQIAWPSGRTLGGGSSINGMVYVRGNRLDYDTWRDSYGCVGWGYADLLPYFRLAEDQQRGESAYHGVGGQLRVEDQRFVHPLSQAWVDAAKTSGMPANDDFNAAGQDGVGFYQLNQRQGRRWSAADAYLRPAAGRANLTIETAALVTKVNIEHGRATGVRYVQGGAEHEVRAEGEVVLAGGTIKSPQMLMLSGIGPGEHLRQYGIDPIVDAPLVGTGLQDHPFCLPEWETPGIPSLVELATPDNVMLWQQEGRGPMASSGAEAGGFGRTGDDLAAPDLQFGAIAAPSYLDLDPASPTKRRGISVMIGAIEVKSRGRLRLRSADPLVKPVIDPDYFAVDHDLEVLVAGIRQAREIVTSPPLADLVAGEHAPGDRVTTDDQLRDWIRRNSGTMFHPTGTCAMGAAADAVCDPLLRVRGVESLRVVDASVMPVIPRGNTNAPTIAIAERAADLIRGMAPPAFDATERRPTALAHSG